MRKLFRLPLVGLVSVLLLQLSSAFAYQTDTVNHVITFTDPGGVTSLAGTVVNTAATNTMFRGIALSPHL